MADQEQQNAGGQDQGQGEGLGGDQNQDQAPDTGATKSDSASGRVQVIHGANSQTFDNLAGSSVGEVRETLAEVFNIPGDAQSLVNGENVGERYRLKPQDTLEFIKQAGVKG